MTLNIEGMGFQELTQLRQQIEGKLDKEHKAFIADLYNQAEKLAAQAGLTLAELVEQGSKGNKRSKSRGAANPVAPRYRNPENEAETWSGRGKPPRWLAAAIADGANRDDFLIMP